ncbi:MAG: hypothetical protein HYV76_02880 [Candidatus Vogelbacteria bacterium]|nr:hypothetical protein [Candidatus Vogelbacteria bacterium]
MNKTKVGAIIIFGLILVFICFFSNQILTTLSTVGEMTNQLTAIILNQLPK